MLANHASPKPTFVIDISDKSVSLRHTCSSSWSITKAVTLCSELQESAKSET